MSEPLRVVLVHRYFFPDTPPYASILASIAEALAARGHDVTVLTCQPSYNRNVVRSAPSREWRGDVRVVRFGVLDDRGSSAKKVVNLVWFCLRLLASSRRTFRDANVVMAATTPPVLVAAVCAVLARAHGGRFIYHKQDIWPEVSGSTSRTARTLRRLDRATERRAARVVVLSRDMAETVRRRGRTTPDLVVINNFDPWPATARGAPAPRSGDPVLTLVFAGSLGRFQGLEHVAEVVRRTADDELIAWHFFGDGALRDCLERVDANVTMHGHRPPEEVASFVRSVADLGVVSLNRSVVRSAYPSKTMTYLRHGCPLLALVEPDSELAEMVVAEGIGVVASQTGAAQVAATLGELARDRSPLAGARERAQRVYRARFDREAVLVRWCDLFEGLTA